jgi:hypothetical protein
MIESEIHRYATLGIFAMAAATLVSLLWVTAPYGRHGRKGWGPTIPSLTGWLVMETPAVLVFLICFVAGTRASELVPLVLLGMWQLHYIHRTYVFPFRMRLRNKRMPWVVPLMGLGFNSVNAYVNARWISQFGSYDSGWLTDPRFLVGATLFAVGFAVNYKADRMLAALRRPGQTDYKIPRGWLYEYIVCPNYLGEILEWTGCAIATWSLPGLGFALFTVANVGPRAFAHRRWYLERFPDFPRRRKALIPFLL